MAAGQTDRASPLFIRSSTLSHSSRRFTRRGLGSWEGRLRNPKRLALVLAAGLGVGEEHHGHPSRMARPAFAGRPTHFRPSSLVGAGGILKMVAGGPGSLAFPIHAGESLAESGGSSMPVWAACQGVMDIPTLTPGV